MNKNDFIPKLRKYLDDHPGDINMKEWTSFVDEALIYPLLSEMVPGALKIGAKDDGEALIIQVKRLCDIFDAVARKITASYGEGLIEVGGLDKAIKLLMKSENEEDPLYKSMRTLAASSRLKLREGYRYPTPEEYVEKIMAQIEFEGGKVDKERLHVLTADIVTKDLMVNMNLVAIEMVAKGVHQSRALALRKAISVQNMVARILGERIGAKPHDVFDISIKKLASKFEEYKKPVEMIDEE
ncbi:MAG: hypothetical protein SVK08_00260 [Halobacteriota archaeon]|nr:hypothetical protein [Halobacteriota archaeon]